MSQIIPYITFRGERQFEKRGFKIDCFDVDRLKGGWIRIYLAWNANNEELHKFKYASAGGNSSSYGPDGESKALLLKFPQVKYRFRHETGSFTTCAEMEIGLKVNKGILKFEPQYFQNRKYAVSVFFSPKDFDTAGVSLSEWWAGSNTPCPYLE